MLDVLLQMTALILCGIGWRLVRPADLDPQQTRKVLTTLVYYLLLPALVLSVLWQAELGARSLQVAASAAVGVFAGMLFAWLGCRVCNARPATTGAVLLAAGFPNATYLGLPVLEATFGPWSRSVAIQYDLFACTPLLFTVGIFTAAWYGQKAGAGYSIGGEMLRIPALWAALFAVALNLGGVPLPEMLRGLLALLERGVVPLMLISLGLSLEWNRGQWRSLPAILPVIFISLLVVPALLVPFTALIGLDGLWRTAVIMEGAMPSMVLGIVLCDRFGLDTSLYATAVTVTTALSLVTLPLWYRLLT